MNTSNPKTEGFRDGGEIVLVPGYVSRQPRKNTPKTDVRALAALQRMHLRAVAGEKTTRSGRRDHPWDDTAGGAWKNLRGKAQTKKKYKGKEKIRSYKTWIRPVTWGGHKGLRKNDERRRDETSRSHHIRHPGVSTEGRGG